MTPPIPSPGAINPGAAPARIWALVPCAGSGSRAGGDVPKQYQNIAGQPMLVHSLNVFGQLHEVAGTLLVLAPSDSYFENNTDKNQINNGSLFIANCGGYSRYESVFNGLNELKKRNISDDDWVLVHDAARCLVTPAQIRALISACVSDPVGGLLALKVPDTIKSAVASQAFDRTDRVGATVDRADKWLAQTPQMFRIGLLRQALQQAKAPVTDESSAIEQLGLQPLLVAGSAENFKVTYPEDFALANSILRARQQAAGQQLPLNSGQVASAGYDYP